MSQESEIFALVSILVPKNAPRVSTVLRQHVGQEFYEDMEDAWAWEATAVNATQAYGPLGRFIHRFGNDDDKTLWAQVATDLGWKLQPDGSPQGPNITQPQVKALYNRLMGTTHEKAHWDGLKRELGPEIPVPTEVFPGKDEGNVPLIHPIDTTKVI